MDQYTGLMNTLKNRFEENMHRHSNIDWPWVQKKLEENTAKLESLQKMESTGGEPDVIVFDRKSDVLTFCDCSPESPLQRRNLCYDLEALESRKKNKPNGNAIDTASEMGIEMLTENQYRTLQKLGEFDTKTSSWVITPPEIRQLGGALFCDRRYDHVFTYHNGAESYYSARGFRGYLSLY